MPLPLGHAAVGIAAAEFSSQSHPVKNWKYYLMLTFLANSPDFDVIVGLLAKGNGNHFHRGMTHSMLFALVIAGFAAWLLRRVPRWPKIQFGTCFLVVFSHIAADLIFTDSPVSLFWPFETIKDAGYRGWLEVLNTIIFEAYRDIFIITGSLLIIFLARKGRKIIAAYL